VKIQKELSPMVLIKKSLSDDWNINSTQISKSQRGLLGDTVTQANKVKEDIEDATGQ
jgi:sec-independent protein translocase protein TatA